MRLLSRRSALQYGAGAIATAMAGCLGNSGSGETPKTTAATSFYVLADFATHIAGDPDQIQNLVPIGQHGHGWEPGPSIQRDVLQSRAFIYVGEGFQLWADDVVQNLELDAPEILVVEAWEDVDLLDAHGHEEDEHEHDARVDPHFWLDPIRAKQAVQTIAAGLEAVDSEQAETYRDGASAYQQSLDQLHAEFTDALASRTKDTVLVAGHNAFQYLGARYDFEVHALSSLSPDDEPTPGDIKEAQQVIEEHDIEYILAPLFESDLAAQQLLEETDATGILPITSVPTMTAEWQAKDWDFIDVMREVNLTTLTEALGA